MGGEKERKGDKRGKDGKKELGGGGGIEEEKKEGKKRRGGKKKGLSGGGGGFWPILSVPSVNLLNFNFFLVQRFGGDAHTQL